MDGQSVPSYPLQPNFEKKTVSGLFPYGEDIIIARDVYKEGY